jgi:DNA-binding MarR family transcriptional regulator
MNIDQIIPIIRDARAIRRKVDRCLRAYALSLNEFELLYILNIDKEITPTAISKLMGQSTPTVSRILTGLSEKGLIIMGLSHEDRRRVSVMLSQHGHELYVASGKKLSLLLV